VSVQREIPRRRPASNIATVPFASLVGLLEGLLGRSLMICRLNSAEGLVVFCGPPPPPASPEIMRRKSATAAPSPPGDARRARLTPVLDRESMLDAVRKRALGHQQAADELPGFASSGRLRQVDESSPFSSRSYPHQVGRTFREA